MNGGFGSRSLAAVVYKNVVSRKLRIFLIVLACLVALPVALLTFENWRGKRDWERYKAAMEAKGEHLELPDFIPPQIPDEKNFMLNPVLAPLFQDSAYAKIVTISGSAIDLDKIRPEIDMNSKATVPVSKGGWMSGMRRDDLAAWQAYYRAALHDVTLDKSPAEDVLAALGRYDGVFATLREAEKTRPLSRSPLHYEKGYMMSLPQYGVMQKMVTVLSHRACAELDLNRTDDALADVQLGFHLMEVVRSDSLFITGLAAFPGWRCSCSRSGRALPRIAGQMGNCSRSRSSCGSSIFCRITRPTCATNARPII